MYKSENRSKYCKIGLTDNGLVLLDNDGKQIPAQTGIEIYDEVEEIPVAKVSLLVNLDEIIDLRNE